MFLEQALRLVSQSPDNLAYHILTLLAVQAALAMSVWQWRQNRRDAFAGRLAVSAAVIFFTRILLAAVLISNTQSELRILIPPLERAIDMGISAVLVWAFLPSIKNVPRLTDVMLIFGLVAIVIGYFLAAQDWRTLAELGISYGRANQRVVWAVAQLVVLGSGLIWVGAIRPRDWFLRTIVLLPLTAAHLAHLLNFVPTGDFVIDSAVPYWVRLAYLVSLPLLAAVAYRHNLAEILGEQLGRRPVGEEFAELLDWSKEALLPPELQATLRGSVKLSARLMEANFAAVGILRDGGGSLGLVALRPYEGAEQDQLETYRWILKLADWPGMQLAFRQRSAVELLPNGIGARQLFGLYQELGIPVAGATLIEPIFGSQEQQIGLLLLGGSHRLDRWSEDDKKLSPHLASHIGYLIENALIFENLKGQVGSPLIAYPDDELLEQEIKAVEAELEAAINQTNVVSRRLEQKQTELNQIRARLQEREAQLQANELALNDLRSQPNVERVFALEEEVQGLREALQQAEEALAMASAGEAGLSTDWVVMAMTRYSAELEEAQRRIAFLEAQLDGSDSVEINDFVATIDEDLRRPLASITGYTDILLSETMGILTKKQRELLERVQDGTFRMEKLLTEVSAQSRQTIQVRPTDSVPPINVAETLEAAVNEIMPLVREKRLVLELDIGTNLPPLAVQRDVLYRVAVDLLRNAAYTSPVDGRVMLVTTVDELVDQDSDSGKAFNFLQLVVRDNGQGIPAEARPFVFDPASYSQNGHTGVQIPGVSEVGEVAHAYTLARLNGGRVWVESEVGEGSNFYVLLPVLSGG